MEFYSFEEIKNAGDCLDYAKNVLMLKPADDTNNQFNIPWRPGSDSGALSIKEKTWLDFVTGDSGSIIDLVSRCRNIDNIAAQAELGKYYNLAPKMQKKKDYHPGSLYDEFLKKGYTVTKEYQYTDNAGNLKYSILRLEHSDKSNRKQFIQRTPKGFGLRGVEMLPYALPQWINSDWVVIVEGEKSADILLENGFPATTNSGGSKKWDSNLNQYFRDKHVIILCDNDDVGKEHGRIVSGQLKSSVQSIKMTTTSPIKGGDVYDYLTDEGKTKEDLSALIASLKPMTEDELSNDQYNPVVQAAKEANTIPFSNFSTVKSFDAKNKPKQDKEPRLINDLLKDLKTRFLGFPKKVGEQLFDQDRETGEIKYIYNMSTLFAWIQQKSGHNAYWGKGEGFVPKGEMFEAVLNSADRCEAISYVPDWPKRKDVHYAHKPLPEPSNNHQYFNEFLNFFSPADENQKVFLKSFIAAPLYYIRGVPKPSWIIDSINGAGVGKTTLVEMVAQLYQAESSDKGGLVRTSPKELNLNSIEVIRRLVSSEGRLSRMLLVDNVVGQFRCPSLADMITAGSISGKAPYGRGEESRPNNINYVLTANAASVDNDIAIRSYMVVLKRPKMSVTWRSDIMKYIKNYRMNIIADIIDILNNGYDFDIPAPSTRFPEFEERILAPMCRDFNQYNETIKTLQDSRASANSETDEAYEYQDVIEHGLREASVPCTGIPVFIQSAALKHWLRKAFPEERNVNQVLHNIKVMIKNNMIANIDSSVEMWPTTGTKRRRGIMWGNYKKGQYVEHIVGIGASNKPERIFS